MPTPVSVVVPTRGDRETLQPLLAGLRQQDVPLSRFEVIIVVDGVTSDTVEQLRVDGRGLQLAVLRLPAGGAIVARNCGAAAATGEVLLFLDDDVVPAAGVIAAHEALHATQARAIGLGYLPPDVTGDSFWSIALRGWWQSVAERVRSPWPRRHFQDLLAGHFSIRRTVFEGLGGFDATLPCQEDFDLAWRAAAAGVDLLAVPEAVAHHRDRSTLTKVLQRREAEARAQVILVRRHPELARSFLLGQPVRGRKREWLCHLAWHQRAAGDLVLAGLLRLLPAYERVKLRYRWRDTVDLALFYVYWRGVASVLGRPEELARLVGAPAPVTPLAVDLADGIDAAAARVDAYRPRAVDIAWGSTFVGRIDDEVGAEPLRGVHLRAILATKMARDYWRAAALHGVVPPALREMAVDPALRADSVAATPDGDSSAPSAMRDGGDRRGGLGERAPVMRELERPASG